MRNFLFSQIVINIVKGFKSYFPHSSGRILDIVFAALLIGEVDLVLKLADVNHKVLGGLRRIAL